MRQVRAHHIAFLLLLACSCAQVVMPGGGEKDTRPPHITAYEPDSAATNFNAKKIVLQFDEYIQLKELNRQLFVSPFVKTTPEVLVKGRSVVINIKDSLKSNTTYTIVLGNAVSDITEGNSLKDLRYVFSTGSYIDSIEIKGNVKSAVDTKPMDNVTVMLYDAQGDSLPLKRFPTYFARSDKDGNYRISNLPPGNYKLFALKDENGNMQYDAADHLIGFSGTPVMLKKDTLIDISMFHQSVAGQFVKSATAEHFGKVLMVFNLPVARLNMAPLHAQYKKQWEVYEYSSGKDSVTYWFTDMPVDTLTLMVSDNADVIDTLEIKIPRKEEGSIKAGKTKAKESFRLSAKLNTGPGNPLDINEQVIIKFNHPIKEYDASLLQLTNYGRSIPLTAEITGAASRGLAVKAQLLADSSYTLYAPPGTFIDIYGLRNDSIKVDFKVFPEKYYGSFKLLFDPGTVKGNLLLQLLGPNELVVREQSVKGAQTLLFDMLPPGLYKIKLIMDSNKNGKWDSGSYFDKLQPEKVQLYPGNVNIRSNWDLEQEWKLK